MSGVYPSDVFGWWTSRELSLERISFQMRSWVFGAIPLVLAALIAGEYFTASANSSGTRTLLASLTQDLRYSYHDCVPLGWQPVPVHDTYYPGYTASVQNYAEWLDALWRGRVPKADLRNPGAHDVFAVLNHLTAAGLLTRKEDERDYKFFLSPNAIPYYYGSSSYRDNRDSLPYLCYSTIVPQRIDWIRKTGLQSYHVQFSWKSSAPPAWAADPFLRSHSVVLAPLTSPTTAKVFSRNGDWYVANIYNRGWMLPALRTQGLARNSRANADSAEGAAQARRAQ